VAHDLAIVGSGPAGVSAALWARSRDLGALLLEAADRPGGQLHRVNFEPRELPGLRTGAGPELAAVYAAQLAGAGVAVRYGARATALEAAASRPVVALEGGERIEAEAVLVATGARRRLLDVPGERELEDRGVSYSATRDRDRLRGRTVAVAGGGDAAFENALILAGEDCDVTLVVRGVPRARREFQDRVAASSRIRVLEHARVTAILGTDAVEALALDTPGGPQRLAVEGVVVKAGEIPNSEWCRDALACDAEGFVLVDARFRTSRAHVWAAGDVVRSPLPSIAVAMGNAALAVADVRRELKG